MAINVPAHRFLYSKYDTVDGHKRATTPRKALFAFREERCHAASDGELGILVGSALLLRKLVLKFVPEERAIETGFAPPGRVAKAGLDLLEGIETKIPIDMPIGTRSWLWAG